MIAIDNYFTLSKVMEMLQEFIIGVIGNVRFLPWWPGKNVKEIDDTQINFNELFWSVDSFGTIILKCMDNGLVFLVATLHNVMDAKNILGGDQG